MLDAGYTCVINLLIDMMSKYWRKHYLRNNYHSW